MQTALGDVVLLDASPMARGGTATVWRGRHVETGLPVAIKLLSPDRTTDPRTRRLILDELYCAATLDHPHVLRILGHGEVPDPPPTDLVPGTPYLVMEWADLGALRVEPGRPWSWAHLRPVLEALLAALGHLHARGLLHRDVKPGNVLSCSELCPRPGLKLADLGLAHAQGVVDDRPLMASPGYAPPEQLDSRRAHEQGPWSDLYALGALATALLRGGPPVADLHAALPLPPDAPPALPQWLSGLLAPAPADRFHSAASALAALHALPGRRAGRLPDGRETVRTDELATPVEPWPRPALPRHLPAPPPLAPELLRRAEQPLVAVRPPRLVGPSAALEALWQALACAAGAGQTGVVEVVGPAGSGRRRLVDELAWRAGEAAGVCVVRIAAGDAGQQSPLAAALRRALGGGRPDDPGWPRRVFERLAHGGADGQPSLARLLEVLQHDQGSRADRARALGWVLEQVGRGEPTLVVLEPGAWAHDTAQVLALAHDGGFLPPGLVVRIVDEPSPGSRWPRVEAQAPTRAELEEALLQAAPGRAALCRALLHRSEGHLPTARLLLARALASGRDGSASPPLLDPGSPWTALLASLPAPWLPIVAAAAALGPRFDTDQWERLCAQLDREIPHALASDLVRAGFWERDPDGFGFADAAARLVVIESPATATLVRAAHAACAALRMRAARPDPVAVGLHLVAADRAEEAAPWLERAVEDALLRSDYSLADRLALAGWGTSDGERQRRFALARIRAASGRGQHEDAIRLADAQVRDPACPTRWRAAALHYRAMATARGPRADRLAAEALLRWAGAEAEAVGEHQLHARALLELSAVTRGHAPAQALPLIQRAGALFAGQQDLHGVADAEAAEADLLVRAGDAPDRAEALLRSALRGYEQIANAYGVARVQNSLGDLLRRRGEVGQAMQMYARARDGFQALGSPEAATAGANLVLLLLMMGDDAEVLARVRELDPLVHARIPVLRPYLGLAAVTAAARRRDPAAYRAALDRWLDGHLDVDRRDRELDELLAQARAAVQQGFETEEV